MSALGFMVVPTVAFRRRLMIAGVLVLVLGLGGAGLVYWEGTRSTAVFDDPSLANFDRQQRIQMERIYGTSYLKMIDIWMGLQRPGPEAVFILVVSGGIAGGCFYVARLARPPGAD